MGNVVWFPASKTPGCPPHDWAPIYDDVVGGDDEEIITGRICVKCSLIEGKDVLALLLGGGGKGKGILRLMMSPWISVVHIVLRASFVVMLEIVNRVKIFDIVLLCLKGSIL